MQRLRIAPSVLGAASLGILIAVLVIASSAQQSSAGSLPPAGTEVVGVTASVDVISRLGEETISFAGTATIERGEPYDEGGVLVIDAEIIALTLTGQSEQGTITVGLWGDLKSTGEIRSTSSSSFPASSSFDAYLDIAVPASGWRTPPPFHLHNNVPLHLVATSNLSSWPPVSATYDMQLVAPPPASPTPGPTPPSDTPDCSAGIRLVPQLPAENCVTAATVTITSCPECQPTATATDTATATLTSTATPSATATSSPTPTSLTPSATATSSSTPTATATASRTPTPSATPTRGTTTATATPSSTPSASETPPPIETPQPSPTITPTPTGTALPTATPTHPPTVAGNGDASCDGATDATDALIVLQYDALLLQAVACPEAADTNDDGWNDALDAALILQYVAGLVGALPV